MDLKYMAGSAALVMVLVGGVAGAAPADDAALADAAERRDTALVRTLLDAGADVNVAQVDGMTALHWAVYHDDADTARVLVASGAARTRAVSASSW